MKIDLQILEKYYDGKMSISERESFEKFVKSDLQAAKDLGNYILSRAAISSAANERLKKHLADSGKTLLIPGQSRSPFTRYLAIAASVAILTGLAWVAFLFVNPPKSQQEVYLSYYERPDISEFSVRGENSDSGMLFWDQGLNYYANHNVKSAAEEFTKILQMNKTTTESKARFMLALCYMEMNEIQKAIQTFEQVSDTSNFVYMKQYYSALCFIKTDKMKEANELLQVIARDKNHPYQKKATRLVREL